MRAQAIADFSADGVSARAEEIGAITPGWPTAPRAYSPRLRMRQVADVHEHFSGLHAEERVELPDCLLTWREIARRQQRLLCHEVEPIQRREPSNNA
jgi:hypothetical protein